MNINILFLFYVLKIFSNISGSFQEIPVSPTSMSYTLWKKSTITTNFYFFNWTNPEKVSEKNYIPEFVELGPYSFKYSK
jgi:hypothetical protein